jgi:Co/Zn/Cd efflux system component
MAGCCEDKTCADAGPQSVDPIWRRALWIALIVNAGMFAAEIASGIAANSSALQADALDFLSDAANYAISLGVAGFALGIRARAAFFKGVTLAALGLWVLGGAAWRTYSGHTLPHAEVMGIVGFIALIANAGVALMLFRFGRGDSNMRSVWICSRNDAIGNVAVMLAALGVFGTGTVWPDLLVATIMAGLSITGGLAIMRQAKAEIRPPRTNAAFTVEERHATSTGA